MTNWWSLILIAEVSAGLLILCLVWYKSQKQNTSIRRAADKALKYQLADRVQPVVDETFAQLRSYIEQLHKQLEKNFSREQESILQQLTKLGTTQQKDLEKQLEKTITEANAYWQRFISEQQRSLQNEVERTHQQHLARLDQIHQEQYAQLEKLYQEQKNQTAAQWQEQAVKLDQAATDALLPLIGQKLTLQLSKDDQHDLAMQFLSDFFNASTRK
jgi:Fe2+ transport system protein B